MRTSTHKAWPKEPVVQQAIVEPLSVETVSEPQIVNLPVKSVVTTPRTITNDSNVIFTLEFTPERLWISLLLLIVLFLSYRVSSLTYQLEKMLR